MPERIAFDTYIPFFDVSIITVIVPVSQFQPVDIVISIDVITIRFILRVIASHGAWIDGNFKLGEIPLGDRCHR